MPANTSKSVERLWELQKVSRATVQAIADQMGKAATPGMVLPQERWDQLFASWEQANQQMQEVGNALVELYGISPRS